MKGQIYIFSILLVFFLACSDQFTEIPAIGALSDEALQNRKGVDLLLTGAYSLLDGIRNNQSTQDWPVSGDNWWFDVLADDAHKGSTDGDTPELFQLETYDWNTANSFFLGKWQALFAGVNRCNAVISLINSIPEEDFSVKLAEARFLRGYYNFELQKIYENVPYISVENYQNTEFNQPNPGPIWDMIEPDFQFAIDNLPPSQEEPGRANSWIAKAFLGKAYLYQSKWSEALSVLQDIIDNGPYDLHTEFVDNFNAAGENGVESIFAIQFAADEGLSYNGNRGGTLTHPGGLPYNSCCGFYQPTQDLVNAYKTNENGLPLLDTYNQTDVKNDYGIESSEPFTPETGALDPRLDFTVGRRGIDFNDWGVMEGKDWIRANFTDLSGPYLPKKNAYQAGEEINMGTGGWGEQRSGINYNIMRFADVLLMAAEAAVETNNLPIAQEYVNRVRSRAKNMTYEKKVDIPEEDAANYKVELYPGFPDQTYARQAVRFERRLELAMESQRHFDLRRWGIAMETMNTYFINEARTIPNFGTKVRVYQPKHNLLPIPLNAIDLSEGQLTQNPGY